MPERLLNKVAVVASGDSAVGRAVALRFLNEGAKVALFGRQRDALEQVARTAPARTLAVTGDVGRSDDLQELVTATTRRFGPANVIVTSFGQVQRVPFTELTPAAVQQLFHDNFGVVLETVRTFLPHLVDAASLVLLTGRCNPAQPAGWGAYQATQSALVAQGRGLSTELAPRGIRVNLISIDVADSSDTRPEDVADVAVFLASDAAGSVTGQEIAVSRNAATGGISPVE